MAELQSVEGHLINGGLGFIPPAIISAEAPETSAAVSAGVSVGSKRLRRPSVRLGDIGGDQYQQVAYDSQVRRPKWRPVSNRKESNQSGKSSSRTRTLTNLSSGGYDNTGTLDEDPIAVGSWRVKKWVKSSGGETTTTSAAKRVRSNWATKIDGIDHGDEKFSGGEEEEEEEEEELEERYRDFSREDSESPMREETLENRNERGEVFKNRRMYENSSGIRVCENREVEVSGDWQSGGRGREGVKIWLQELGFEGAGVLPETEEISIGGGGDIMYMRAKFERIVGSRDSEAFYMMNPDSNGAPELSIHLLRI